LYIKHFSLLHNVYICSWNQPVLSSEGRGILLKKAVGSPNCVSNLRLTDFSRLRDIRA